MVWYAHGMAYGIACMVGHEYAHTLREGGCSLPLFEGG